MIGPDENKKQVDAIRHALNACSVGDVPDTALGVLSILRMNGWSLVPSKQLRGDK